MRGLAGIGAGLTEDADRHGIGRQRADTPN
jgi:hypothetical protein